MKKIITKIQNAHELCGDDHLSLSDRIYYFLYHAYKGISGNFALINTKYFHPTKIEKGTASPGRKYLNQFFREKLPTLVLIGNIKVLDVGCGNGYIRSIFSELGYKGQYTGVDIYQNDDYYKFEYPEIESELIIDDFSKYETKTKYDLIITNTCLEHVKDDVEFIDKCTSLLSANGQAIHIIPSNWGLYLFMWHGYRQYNKQMIKKLIYKLPSKIYRLGGLFTFIFHFLFITFPNLIMYGSRGKIEFKMDSFRKSVFYETSVKCCNIFDKILSICSHYYIIVINNGQTRTLP